MATPSAIPGLNRTFWGLTATIFGGLALAGLGRGGETIAYGLLGGGLLLVLTGIGQRTRYAPAPPAPVAKADPPVSDAAAT